MLEWNCGQKHVQKRVTSAPDLKCFRQRLKHLHIMSAELTFRLQFGDQGAHFRNFLRFFLSFSYVFPKYGEIKTPK